MTDNLTRLPDWIKRIGKKFFVLKTMEPLKCSNCGVTWYPRIMRTGEIILPGTCPDCRTKAYRKKRDN